MRSRAGRMLALGLIFGLLPASQAQALDRYADAVAGTNDNDATCTVPPPGDGCEIGHAIQGGQTQPGDRIIIAPGNYVLGASIIQVIDSNLELVGPGAAQATISSSAGTAGIYVTVPGVTISGLRIDYAALGSGLVFNGTAAGATVDRVSITANAPGGSAVRIVADGLTTLRDSVFRQTNSTGIGAVQTGGGTTPTASLLNVTAHSTGAAPALNATSGAGEDSTVTVRNSVLSSLGGPDVFAKSPLAGDTVAVNLDFSSYTDWANQYAVDPADATVTEPGTLSNVAAPGSFTDTDLTFHQAAGSPTIDKGSAAFATTPLDIDGGARIVNGIPDIGADEFLPSPPGPGPPAATGQRAAALKKCKKKKSAKARKKCKKKAQKLPV